MKQSEIDRRSLVYGSVFDHDSDGSGDDDTNQQLERSNAITSSVRRMRDNMSGLTSHGNVMNQRFGTCPFFHFCVYPFLFDSLFTSLYLV